jgi:hypothetical protein
MSRMRHAGRVQQTSNKTNKQTSVCICLAGIFIHRHRMISVAPLEIPLMLMSARDHIKIIENDCQSGAYRVLVFVLAAPLGR